MLKTLGVQANLLQDFEMRDKEEGFLKRLNMDIPNVLSNVYPKDPSTDFNKLQQFYTTSLPGGINLYIINLFDVENVKRFKSINVNYEAIPPIEFLESFINQIDPADVLIARINIKDTMRITDVLESDAAKRIDLVLLPHGVSKDFVTSEERSLSKLNTGWRKSTITPYHEAQEKKAKEDRIKKYMDDKKAKLQEETEKDNNGAKGKNTSLKNPDDGSDEIIIPGKNPNGILPDSTDEKLVTGDEQPDLNQEAKANVPPLPAELTNEPISRGKDSKGKEKLSAKDVDLTVESREFMDILNEYHAVPEPRSAEYLREIYFQRTIDGEYTIKVSDILIDKRYPEDGAIKGLVDDCEKVVALMKTKESVKRQITYTERKVSSTGENPYVGPQTCKECHEEAYDIWASSKHAHTLELLENRGQQDDERCLKCHLTEWTKPAYYVKEWTFDKFAPELGCETCHGPGAAHVRIIDYALQGNRKEYWDIIKTEKPNLFLRDLRAEAKTVCTQCHDKMNSPDFDFIEYWSMIEHPSPVLEDPLDKIIKIRSKKQRKETENLREKAKEADGK
ncbi:hypothetical protein J7L05_03800 [bacterium]|nr:hypothetical protein [bacterium]